MEINGLIYKLSKELKWLIAAFVIVLSIGFYSGLLFVGETSSANPNGIEEHYLGNESDEEAMIMKFKKSEQEMLTLVHNHILSMSIIFFLVGILLSITRLKKRLKLFYLCCFNFWRTLFTLERSALDEIYCNVLRNFNDINLYDFSCCYFNPIGSKSS